MDQTKIRFFLGKKTFFVSLFFFVIVRPPHQKLQHFGNFVKGYGYHQNFNNLGIGCCVGGQSIDAAPIDRPPPRNQTPRF